MYQEGRRFYRHLQELSPNEEDDTRKVRDYYEKSRGTAPISQLWAYRKFDSVRAQSKVSSSHWKRSYNMAKVKSNASTQVRTLGELFRLRKEPGVAGLPVLSVTVNRGLVIRDSLERKDGGKLSPNAHLLIRKGDIAYNMMRMWQGASGLAKQDRYRQSCVRW